jgi:hypothetical protein
MSNAVRISDSCEGVKPVVAAALLDLRRFEGGYILTDIQLGHKIPLSRRCQVLEL